MKRALIFGLLLASLGAVGCQGSYTSIRQVDAARYQVTRTKQGFFHTYGTVLDCQAKGDEMTCTEISDM
ncbi:hypothetical protein SOCE26_000530 [Sorangium cellulosum]|uniref:Secreted protein n=1 Tax=Sorangium cellulosum TaxID=56 RepID=A0A2L0EH95_SORCE|nr:hypothetical protein [Sorangium cellulosum]AUX38675.1 hypothetical protein SOCE26_000530 [Sorangium cellulosum]